MLAFALIWFIAFLRRGTRTAKTAAAYHYGALRR